MYRLLEIERNKKLMARDAEREKYLRSLPPDQRQDAFFAWPDVQTRSASVHVPEASTSAVPISTEGKMAAEEEEEEPARKRRKIDPCDPWGFNQFVPDITTRFPALTQRNFYVIQLHHATTAHYDIRLQCTDAHVAGQKCIICGDGKHQTKEGRVPGTLSFACPRGLSGLGPKKHRLAIETELHEINYSVYEGFGIGPTLLYDIGTFKIVSPYGSKKDKEADTSDEDSDEEIASPPVYGGKIGANQERALSKVYKGNSEKSSFSIELKGKRYHMRLSFSLDKTSKQTKIVDQKWHGRQTLRRSWIIQLARPLVKDGERLNYEDKSIGEVSILTGKPLSYYKQGQQSVAKLSDVYNVEEAGNGRDVLVQVLGFDGAKKTVDVKRLMAGGKLDGLSAEDMKALRAHPKLAAYMDMHGAPSMGFGVKSLKDGLKPSKCGSDISFAEKEWDTDD